MKIFNRGTIILGRSESALLATNSPKALDFSRALANVAINLAYNLGASVEVYASKRHGGHLINVYHPTAP